MIKFIIKRIIFGFFVLIGTVIVTFFIFQVLPGDPATIYLPKNASQEDIEIVRHRMGLDKSKGAQLLAFLRDLSPISSMELNAENEKEYEYEVLFKYGKNSGLVVKWPYLRRSYKMGGKVTDIMRARIGSTLILALTAMTFATIIGVLMGIIASLNQNSFTDHFMVIGSVVGISAPSFVAGSLIGLLFADILKPYTGLDMHGSLWVTYYSYEVGDTVTELRLENLILPALTLGLRPLAIIVQLTRSSMLDVLRQDYIRTAKAKGLPYRKVVMKHALKNALNPVITAVSGWMAALMAGAFFVEYIFNYDGIGFITIKQGVENSDFPLVMGAVIIVAVFFIFINILVDILYAVIDPRVRLS